jgi:outer membrane immunogenic protein
MVRKLLMTTALVCLAGGAALAADLPSEKGPPVYAPPPPPPPAFTWSGVYIGGQVGYGFGTSGAYDDTLGPLGTFNTSGVVGGAHIGYNYQISQLVFGLEGDVNGSTEGGSYLDPVSGTNTITTHKNYDASIRGRIGYAWDRVLIYATGGGAYGDFRTSFSNATPAFDGDYDSGHFGWTVGGGIEYAIDNNWSVRAEYRYTDYGRIYDYSPTVYGTGPGGDTISQHLRDNRVQVGFSYKFDLFAPPAPIVSKY